MRDVRAATHLRVLHVGSQCASSPGEGQIDKIPIYNDATGLSGWSTRTGIGEAEQRFFWCAPRRSAPVLVCDENGAISGAAVLRC